MQMFINFSLKTWDKNKLTKELFINGLQDMIKYSPFKLMSDTVKFLDGGANTITIKAELEWQGGDLIFDVCSCSIEWDKRIKEWLKIKTLDFWLSKDPHGTHQYDFKITGENNDL